MAWNVAKPEVAPLVGAKCSKDAVNTGLDVVRVDRPQRSSTDLVDAI
jgi:hypothetical protein